MTQKEYLEILFHDCGFTPAQRRAWLNAEFGTVDIDALTPGERSRIIEDFKERRRSQSGIPERSV